ncbi:GNAT family N-acetyltransferase [Actinacidiphila alni]
MDICAETRRLRLRRFGEGDGEALVALHGDAEVMRWIDDGRPVAPEVVVGVELAGIVREYGELAEGMGCFAVEEKEQGAFAGWVALRPARSVGLDEGGVELGYRMRPGVWGRGYATEAARAVLRKAFTELGVERVEATTMTVNAASRRVLEKAGLAWVRTFFAQWDEPIEGAEHGDVVYAAERDAWLRRHDHP